MKKKLWHLIEANEEHPEGKDWHLVDLHATDAAHALNVDPDHWKVAKPDASTLESPIMGEEHPDDLIGDAGKVDGGERSESEKGGA